MFARNVRLGFQVGLVAGAAAGLVSVVARLALGVPTVPELVLDQLTILVPPALFAFILDRLLFLAKPLVMAGIVVGQLLLSGALGALYGRVLDAFRPSTRSDRLRLALGLGGVVWILAIVGLLPLLGAGLFGAETPVGAAVMSATLLVAALTYGLGLAFVGDWGAEAAAGTDREASPGRRRLLRALGWGAVAVAAGAIVLHAVSLLASNAAATLSSRRPPGRLPPEVTPTGDFYVVSKNLADPAVDGAKWSLEVTGLVERPITLDYGQLTALPAVEQYVTLECISNAVGGDLISNANWKGAPLRDLLEMAGPRPGIRKVVLTATDGYEDSIPFERAMNPASLLAWEMNGEKLPPAHGFPARLLVPGIYGMKNVKWVTAIQLVDYDFKGYWQQRGWSDEALVKTMSRIDVPSGSEGLPAGSLPVGGIAFSGDRGIGGVEVSVDGGKTWQRAAVKQALSPYTWVLWMFDWRAPPGRHNLLVRAADMSGQLQEAQETDTLPDGVSGYYSIVVRVEPG